MGNGFLALLEPVVFGSLRVHACDGVRVSVYGVSHLVWTIAVEATHLTTGTLCGSPTDGAGIPFPAVESPSTSLGLPWRTQRVM